MKQRLLMVFFALFLSAVWLFPMQYTKEEWILLGGFFAAFLCLALIPPKYAAFGAAVAVTLGMGIRSSVFFAGFAPSVGGLAALFALRQGDARKPVKKDGFLLTAILCEGIFIIGSLFYSLIFLRGAGFGWRLDRGVLWILFAFLCIAFLLVRCVRMGGAAQRRKNSSYNTDKQIPVMVLQLICIAAALLFCFRHMVYPRVFLLPGLYCAADCFVTVFPTSGSLFAEQTVS